MAWAADDECDVTVLQTLGMSDHAMPGTGERVELHMAVRAPLTEPQRNALAQFLANMSLYPFDHGCALDWWHTLAKPGPIPHFPGCAHVLLHPRFTEEGFDTIDDEDGLVKVLYVVPITAHERHLLIDHGRTAFVDHLVEHEIDLFADR
jgi:hypothetical protein